MEFITTIFHRVNNPFPTSFPFLSFSVSFFFILSFLPPPMAIIVISIPYSTFCFLDSYDIILFQAKVAKSTTRIVLASFGINLFSRPLSDSIRGCVRAPRVRRSVRRSVTRKLDGAISAEIAIFSITAPAQQHYTHRSLTYTCISASAHPQATTSWPCIRPCVFYLVISIYLREPWLELFNFFSSLAPMMT